MELFLTALSGIAWSIVYIGCIYKGFKDKTFGMPLFALALNFSWELICSVGDIFFSAHGPLVGLNAAQAVTNVAWVLCDTLIVVTYFRFGKERFPQRAQQWFLPFSLLVFASCFAIQMAFQGEFGPVAGSQYSAFLQNVLMSVLFLTMLYRRDDTRGQSLVIAFAKWIGTLAPTILFGVLAGFNVLIVVSGVICSIFDLLYCYCLMHRKQEEQTLK